MPLEIIYVDDEVMLLEVTKEFLEADPGIHVDTVGSAEDALQMIGRKAYDLVLSDYQMFPMDGIQLLQRLRKDGNQVPFIIFTGKGREDVVIQAIDEGADFYVQKGGDPVSLYTELRHKIILAVQRRQQQMEIQQYDDIINLMDTGLMVFRGETADDVDNLRLINANPWIARIFDEMGVEAIGRTWKELFSRVTDQHLVSKIEQMVRKRESLALHQYNYPRPDGTPVYYSLTAFPLPDNCYGVLVKDVTDLVLASDELRNSEQKYRAIFENNRVATAVFRADDYRFVDANEGWLRTYGYGRDEILKRTMLDLSAEPEKTSESLRNLVRLGSEQVYLRYHKKKDGTRFPVEISASTFNLKGQQLVSVIIQDVTGRIRAEELLRRRLLVASDPDWDVSQFSFEELFDLEEIQRIQDSFSEATGVASLITKPDGTPITRPSNFCRLCKIIRSTQKGAENCHRSDSALGVMDTSGPKVQTCLSGGMWDAGASISFGGKHVANWLIGQVLDQDFDRQRVMSYAKEIGADEKEFRAALGEVKTMSRAQFDQAAWLLYVLANQMSNLTLQNMKQARFIMEKNQAELDLVESEKRFRELTTSSKEIIAVIDPVNGTISQVNDVIETVLGRRPEEVTGRSFIEFFPLEERPRLHRLVGEMVASPGTARETEAVAFDRFGEKHLFDMHALARRNVSGGVDILVRATDITSRHDLQEKLRASEEMYRSLVNTIPDALVICDLGGIIKFISPATMKLFRFPEDDPVVGGSILDVVEPESMASVRSNIAGLVSGGKINPVPYRLRRFDGTKFWCDIRSSVSNDDAGRPKEIISIMRDISDKIEADKELEESERRLTLALESAGQGFFVFDTATLTATYSDNFSELVGYPFEEIGNGFDFWQSHIHPGEVKDWEGVMSEIGGDAGSVRTEYRLRGQDGTYRWFESHATSVRDHTGKVLRIIGVVKDIDERKRGERALQASERHYRELVENATETITIIQDQKICLINNKGLEVSGYSREEVIGRSPFMFIHPDDRQRTIENHQKMLRSEPRDEYEIRFLTKSGGLLWVKVSGALIEWNGRPAVLNFYSDISDKRRSEDAIRMANRKLNLLSSITRHDILNQLTMLMGAIELQHIGVENEEANYRRMVQAARNIERQISFTRDYESMGVKSPEWQTLGPLAERVLQQFNLGKVKVTVDLGGWSIYADPLLEKVFYNLVDNSVRYGQNLSSISIMAQERDGVLELVFADDGVGIPSADKERVFNRGFGKNTGYGMFLSREILSLTSIAIMENGGPGKGARFVLSVPNGHYRQDR